MAYEFVNNKYTKWYFEIINHAQLFSRDGYVERHHIIPKSLGGDDSDDNLIRLSAREHLVCHLLLIKMCVGKDKHLMAYALRLMCVTRKSSSRTYSFAKKEFSKAQGRVLTEEHKRNIAKSLLGKSHKQPMKKYIAIDENGNEFLVLNRTNFCKTHNLDLGRFSNAACSGKIYRGWKISTKIH